ncbi:terminase small subunit [Mesorhizobium sp. ORM6]
MIDLNATHAAIRAGSSELTAQVQGSRLLSMLWLPRPSQPSRRP